MKESPRQRAIRLGQTSYVSKKPCVNGHLDKRNTLSGECLVCCNERIKRTRELIREKKKGVAHGE